MFELIEGRKIWYTDSGKGDPVVLLHGYLESAEIWNGFADQLAKTYRVICIDLPGHGKSEVFSETHTMEFMAQAVKELLGRIDIQQAFMTGHSLGGYVTIAFADLYPSYLTGYSLFHSHPFADTPEGVEKRKNDVRLAREGKKELIYPEAVRKMFANSNAEKLSGEMMRAMRIAADTPGKGIVAVQNGMMLRPSRQAVMEEGKKPCLWILGRLDNYIPFEAMSRRVKLPANAKLEVLDNSGHMGFIEERDRVVQILREFLDSIGY